MLFDQDLSSSLELLRQHVLFVLRTGCITAIKLATQIVLSQESSKHTFDYIHIPHNLCIQTDMTLNFILDLGLPGTCLCTNLVLYELARSAHQLIGDC